MVVRTHIEQSAKLRLDLDIAEFGDICLPAAGGVKADHIGGSDVVDESGEELRVLHRRGRNGKASPAGAPDSEVCGSRVIVLDEVAGTGNEVVHGVLLGKLCPAACQASPNSPPPRTWAHAMTPPCSISARGEAEKKGSIDIPYEP